MAIISLFVAVTSLGYNTWRNETTETHRNWREAAFEATKELNNLQQHVLFRRYFFDQEQQPFNQRMDAETWIGGWRAAMTVRDLTSVLPPPLPEKGKMLLATWDKHAGDLNSEGNSAENAEQALMQTIDDNRTEVLALIESLD